jgi:sporulation protein YlmC with PRC-barrel domain
MAHVGTLRDYEFATEAEDIRGSNLYGQDDAEKLGTIDDVIFDHGTGEIRYVVVVLEGGPGNRKFLVPGNSLQPSAKNEDDFSVPLSKEQAERLPAFDEKTLERNEDWGEYERKYNLVWEESPVMHIKGSDRVLIPETETSGSGSSVGSAKPPASAQGSPNLQKEGGVVGRYEPRQPNAMPPLSTESHDIGTAELRSPAGTPASEASAKTTTAVRQRWQNFEERLRNNRQEILERCGVCNPQSGRQRDVA